MEEKEFIGYLEAGIIDCPLYREYSKGTKSYKYYICPQKSDFYDADYDLHPDQFYQEVELEDLMYMFTHPFSGVDLWENEKRGEFILTSIVYDGLDVCLVSKKSFEEVVQNYNRIATDYFNQTTEKYKTNG